MGSDSSPRRTWGEQNTEAEAHEQLDAAVAAGVDFIDTAELYPVPAKGRTAGLTEEYIGSWLRQRSEGDPGLRGRLVIASKVCGPGTASVYSRAKRELGPGERGPDEPGGRPEECLFDRSSIRASVEASLARLNTTYLDLLQLHWPERFVPCFGRSIYDTEKSAQGYNHVAGAVVEPTGYEDVVRSLGELIAEGKVRHWGLSNETTYGVCQFCEAARRLDLPEPVSIQNDFSLCDRRFETELAEACAPHHYDVALLPYGVLGGGALTGKYLDNTAEAGSRHVKFPNFQPRYIGPLVMEACRSYSALAKEHGLTMTQLALSWCKSRSYVGSTIIGATKLWQLQQCIEAFQIDLPETVLEAIDAIHFRNRNPQMADPANVK